MLFTTLKFHQHAKHSAQNFIYLQQLLKIKDLNEKNSIFKIPIIYNGQNNCLIHLDVKISE